MKCGVRFCGGCNPRYDRGEALNQIKDRLKDSDIEFKITTEDEQYDDLLIIGGCTNCCAGYDQFTWSGKNVGGRAYREDYKRAARQLVDIYKIGGHNKWVGKNIMKAK